MTREELRDQDLHDLKTVFELNEGRRFLARIIDFCGFFRSSYSGEETNAMMFKEGARNVALNILSLLTDFDEDAVHKIIRANYERSIDDEGEEEI